MGPSRLDGDIPSPSAIADVLALWGQRGSLTPPMAPIVAPLAVTAGRATTVTLGYGPSTEKLGPLYDLLDGDLRDRVLVIAGAESIPGAVWGEILATAGERSGLKAVLVHGAVRDLADLPPTPLYALGSNVVGPSGYARVLGLDECVRIGDVNVDAQDWIVSDATGCVRVGAGDDDVFDAASTYADAESHVARAVRAGHRLAEAYAPKQRAVAEIQRRSPYDRDGATRPR